MVTDTQAVRGIGLSRRTSGSRTKRVPRRRESDASRTQVGLPAGPQRTVRALKGMRDKGQKEKEVKGWLSENATVAAPKEPGSSPHEEERRRRDRWEGRRVDRREPRTGHEEDATESARKREAESERGGGAGRRGRGGGGRQDDDRGRREGQQSRGNLISACRGFQERGVTLASHLRRSSAPSLSSRPLGSPARLYVRSSHRLLYDCLCRTQLPTSTTDFSGNFPFSFAPRIWAPLFRSATPIAGQFDCLRSPFQLIFPEAAQWTSVGTVIHCYCC